jgi:hypothetical protein
MVNKAPDTAIGLKHVPNACSFSRIDASTLQCGGDAWKAAIISYANKWHLITLLLRERPSFSRIGPDECPSCPARKRIRTGEPLCMMDTLMDMNVDSDGKLFFDPTILDAKTPINYGP